jgi:CTD small phosphatase-like protein 2
MVLNGASCARLLHDLMKLAPRGQDGLCFVVHSVVSVAAALVTLAVIFSVASASVPTAALLLVCVLLVVGLQLTLVARGVNPKVGPSSRRSRDSTVERQSAPKLACILPKNPSKLEPVARDILTPLPRLQVVLDMDECLIHSCYQCGNCGRQALAKVPSLDGPPSNPLAGLSTMGCGICYQVSSGGEPFIVCKRPGVDEFLARVSTFCDTYLFTSATREYATPVINLLDPLHTTFKGVYTREYTTKNEFISGPVHVKDLTAIMSTSDFQQNLPPAMSMTEMLARVVLVDNNPLSFIPQPSNGILVKNFYHDIEDTALSRVWEMLCELQRAPDVRVSLKPLFLMEETLTSLQAQQQQAQQQAQQEAQEAQQAQHQQNLVYLQHLSQPQSLHQMQHQHQQAGRPSITTPPPPSTNTAVALLEGQLLAAIEMQDLERVEDRTAPLFLATTQQPQIVDLAAVSTGKRKLL